MHERENEWRSHEEISAYRFSIAQEEFVRSDSSANSIQILVELNRVEGFIENLTLLSKING